VKKVSQGTETEISTLRRLKKQKKPPRRSIPAANPVDEAGSASPTTAERRSRDGTKLIRRHLSRASSVDRREIFQKYIQNSNENADEIRPYEDHDPELKAEQAPTAVEDKSPEFNLMKSPSIKKEFRLVRIVNKRRTDLGMFIARCKQTEVGLVGYFVVHISSSGLVKRDGRLMVGDTQFYFMTRLFQMKICTRTHILICNIFHNEVNHTHCEQFCIMYNIQHRAWVRSKHIKIE